MLLLGLLWQLGRRRANRLSKIPAGMGCVCVCVWGLFQGFVQSSGWWLRPLPGRRWLGGLSWDCRRLVHPVLVFSFFFWLSRRCRVGRVGVQQLSIPGLLPASLSHVLNAARWVGWERVPPGLSHPLAAGGCCSPRVLALGLAAGREGGA